MLAFLGKNGSMVNAQHLSDILASVTCYLEQQVLEHSGLDVIGHAGNSDNAAYLANVCVAQCARRRGVGGALLEAARQQARAWGMFFTAQPPNCMLTGRNACIWSSKSQRTCTGLHSVAAEQQHV